MLDPAAIRRGTPADISAIAAILAASPEAAQWDVAGCLDLEFVVATTGSAIAGFAVWRDVAPDERELLNLAVSPDFRRKGVGRALLSAVLNGFSGSVFLEVRASNTTAQEFYKSLNFKVISVRDNYYQYPPEAAIVMKFHSC